MVGASVGTVVGVVVEVVVGAVVGAEEVGEMGVSIEAERRS